MWTCTNQLEPKLRSQGLIVETPAVRIPDRGVAYWRVRAGGGASLSVRVTPRDRVRSVEVAFPAVYLGLFGYRVDWPVWFLAISLITMLVVPRLGIPALRL